MKVRNPYLELSAHSVREAISGECLDGLECAVPEEELQQLAEQTDMEDLDAIWPELACATVPVVMDYVVLDGVMTMAIRSDPSLSAALSAKGIPFHETQGYLGIPKDGVLCIPLDDGDDDPDMGEVCFVARVG